MSRLHGRKIYLQILLDPFRAELFEQLAEERGVKRTALVREIIYQWTAKQAGSTLYKDAERKDAALWADSVANRIEGRKKAAEARKRDNKAKAAQAVPVVVTPSVEPVTDKGNSLLGAISRLLGN